MILQKQGRHRETLKAIEHVLQKRHKLEQPVQLVDAFIVKARSMSWLGRPDEGLVAITQGEQALQTLAQEQTIEAGQKKFFRLRRRVGKLPRISPEALTQRTARLMLVKGTFYLQKGDLDQGMKYVQQSLKLFEDINDQIGRAMATNNLGEIYRLKGELDQALKYYQQSLALAEETGDLSTMNTTDGNIGLIYKQKGDAEQALTHFERSLTVNKELRTNHGMAYWLNELISITIDMNSLEQAKKYLQHLQQINTQVESKRISQTYRLARALLLKTSDRLANKFDAQKLFQQVAEEEIVDWELTVTALLHLCELLLLELKTTSHKEVLNEVKVLTQRLLTIANQQPSYWLLAETYVLQSKLSLLELNKEKAQKLLEQALLIAEERGLRNLAIKIYSDQTFLEEQVDRWQYLIERNAPLSERLEYARLEELITRVARKRLEVTEEEISRYAERAKRLVQAME